MEMGMEERNKPIAIFMAFGTKGDVYPVAAIAAAFACDQKQYSVVLITHSAHENLGHHLAEKHVTYYPISSPPVLSVDQDHETTSGPASLELSFTLQKRIVKREHRQECYSAVERMFGCSPSLEGDFIAINFFALEGWSLAEMFRIRCIVVAPYVVPYRYGETCETPKGPCFVAGISPAMAWNQYSALGILEPKPLMHGLHLSFLDLLCSAPSSFERQFRKEEPLLYRYLQEAPINKVCWKDVIHWMWPLFTENWGSWRCDDLNLSAFAFTDPVTGLPTWHDRTSSPLLLYGFSKEVVECPGNLQIKDVLCSAHLVLQNFLKALSTPPIFVGLSSVGSMGFLKNPRAFLRVLQTVIEITSHRFILFTAGFEPLVSAVRMIAAEESSHLSQRQLSEDCISIFDGQLFCFTGSMPYKWLFPQCLAAIHHGGSGVTAAALHSGIPQVVCPFMLDQFYWAERMFWLGVAPEPLKSNHLLPDRDDDISIQEAATVLSRALNNALSPGVKACSVEIAGRISLENGVLEAVKNLKEELSCPP